MMYKVDHIPHIMSYQVVHNRFGIQCTLYYQSIVSTHKDKMYISYYRDNIPWNIQCMNWHYTTGIIEGIFHILIIVICGILSNIINMFIAHHHIIYSHWGICNIVRIYWLYWLHCLHWLHWLHYPPKYTDENNQLNKYRISICFCKICSLAGINLLFTALMKTQRQNQLKHQLELESRSENLTNQSQFQNLFNIMCSYCLNYLNQSIFCRSNDLIHSIVSLHCLQFPYFILLFPSYSWFNQQLRESIQQRCGAPQF